MNDAAATVRLQLAVIDGGLAAADHGFGSADDPAALVGRVAYVLVQIGAAVSPPGDRERTRDIT